MNSEVRKVVMSNDNIKAAIEEFLHRMKLIKDDEQVFTWTSSDFKDSTDVHIKREVLN